MPHKTKIDQNDPRISGMIRGANARERFVLLGMATLLASAGQLDQVLSDLNGDTMEVNERVADHPFSHWIGKNARDVRRECKTQEECDAVAAAFKARGIELDSGEETKAEEAAADAADAATAETADGAGEVTAPATAPTAAAKDAPVPKFAGKPVTKLAGKTDAELLKIKGIGKAAIAKIREWEAAQPRDLGLGGNAAADVVDEDEVDDADVERQLDEDEDDDA